MACNDNVLKVDNLDFSYEENHKKTLSNINFSVSRGNFLGIIGPNGSGKTTLLKIISGILKPSRGKITVFGKELANLSIEKIAQFTSVVPQETSVIFDFKVKEVVFMGRLPFISRINGETIEDYEISREAMERAKCLSLAEKNIHEISGGEKQRVFIAKALAQTPQLLLLDEFTSHLDINYKHEVVKFFKKVLENDKIIIISAFHDLNLASILSNRLILLNEGKIEKIGTPQDVINEDIFEKVYGTRPTIINHPILHIPQVII